MSANNDKAAISVGEMAKRVGLSRARFYDLLAQGVFPRPERHPETGRPFYSAQLQAACLKVRRTHRGIDGKPVLFYSRQSKSEPQQTPARKRHPLHATLIDALKALGLSSVTTAQVGEAISELFPQGRQGVAEADVIRSLFLHLRRKSAGR